MCWQILSQIWALPVVLLFGKLEAWENLKAFLWFLSTTHSAGWGRRLLAGSLVSPLPSQMSSGPQVLGRKKQLREMWPRWSQRAAYLNEKPLFWLLTFFLGQLLSPGRNSIGQCPTVWLMTDSGLLCYPFKLFTPVAENSLKHWLWS